MQLLTNLLTHPLTMKIQNASIWVVLNLLNWSTWETNLIFFKWHSTILKDMLRMTYSNALWSLFMDTNMIMVLFFSWCVGYVCGWILLNTNIKLKRKWGIGHYVSKPNKVIIDMNSPLCQWPQDPCTWL
jgi:hypothetical protein